MNNAQKTFEKSFYDQYDKMNLYEARQLIEDHGMDYEMFIIDGSDRVFRLAREIKRLNEKQEKIANATQGK